MPNLIYNSTHVDLMKGNINFEADNIKVMVVTSAYVPNQDTHTKRSHVTNEVTGAGYTAGGVSLTGKTVTQDNTANKGVFDADDAVIPSVTISGSGAVIYKSRGGAASADELIGYIDFGEVKTSTNGNFAIQFPVEGIYRNGSV